jgi:hypothetical protein
MNMNGNTLPAEFKDLAPWLDWAKPTEPERYAQRAKQNLDKVRAFFDALQPHMEDVIRYLSKFPWGEDLGEADKNLYLLGLAYMEASIPVDLKWKQGENPGAFDYGRVSIPARW